VNDRAHEPLTEPLMDEGFHAGDPFPTYARLRAENPVAWNADLGYWALSRHADVLAVSRDPETFCSRRGILTFEIGVEYESPPTMMHTDPPEHTRYRKLVQPAFAPSIVRALEPAVRDRARGLLDRITPGEPVDFVNAVSIEFPLMIISDLLGVPGDDWQRFYEWSEAVIPGARPEWTDQHRQALQAEMHEYLLTVTNERRGAPAGDDVISVLANVEVDLGPEGGGSRESLDDAEIVMFLNQLLVAGNETTRNTISGGMWAFAENPQQWDRLRADRSLVATAVEEWLRWTTAVIYFMRTATRDVEIRGREIAAGDPVVLLYASANRDEEEFGPSADRFDVARDPNHHLAFGFGAHFCLGAALARLEARVLVEELLDRFAEISPAGELVRSPSFVIAGVKSCPITLT
jgi:cytochrome P450